MEVDAEKSGRRNWLTSLLSFLFWQKLTDNQGVFKVKQGQGSHVWGDGVLLHNSEDDNLVAWPLSVTDLLFLG